MEGQTWLMDQKVVEMVERLKLRDLVRLDDEFRCDELRGIIRGMIGLLSSPNLANFYPVFMEFDLQGLRKKYRELSMKMWAFWETILKEARDLNKGEFRQFNFLDSLLSRGFGDDQINQLLEELFTAGMDTTTSTIKRTMMEVISRAESMTKLKHELDSTSINHTNTSQVENLPYLQACVKETLRLHPPAPLLLSHRALETCQVMNYTVPKNARVLVNVWAIGRDPAVWEEPMEYKPERFLGLSMDFKGNDFKLLPFGSGRRICPGMPMAAKIVPSIVASLVYFFNWSSLHGTTHVDEMSRAASRITDPLLLIPRARKLSINSR